MSALLDQDARDRAIHERERNVIVDASAGTGKTKLIVERLLELVAPTDGRDPIPIDRIAAITFTRKAAGELRVRTRQLILETLASLHADSPRTGPLLRALGGIDTANISTIHGFADRLLRKWPAQARLDPMYELDENIAVLTEECCQLLVQGAANQTLGELLGGSPAAPRAEEAISTILDAQRAGIRLQSLETEHWTYHGLDGLVSGFVLHRDVEAPDPPAAEFNRAAFQRFAEEYLALIDGLSSEGRGGRWLLENGEVLRRASVEFDPVVVFRELVDRMERGPRGKASDPPRRGHDFAGDDRAWDVWKAFDGDERQEPVRATPLRDDLLGPLRCWLAIRVVRLRPVVLHVYELVKRRHQAVDHVDLLLRLRNLLRDDRAIRRSCQLLFDHVFVDEFQDTDPLQAEIILFLCERGAEAASWDAVKLAPGILTVVGDPKQSIYRFRRADIGTYQRVVEIIARSPHLAVQLTSSFRSAPGLVDWLNGRFADVLGTSEHGERFRRGSGEVFHQSLTKGRASGVDPTVHAVAIGIQEGGTAAEVRAIEADVMARYLRWLVEVRRPEILDPITSGWRAVGYGDVGVLAITTTNLPVLFDAFDREGIPYAARGGRLFLADPLHRRFLLGLCALADRDDGVALAALLRPPFFAIDLGDLARTRADDPADPAVQARGVVRELRRRRFERSPGTTARALLEDTAIARTIVLGPNGVQRLSGLRELCFQVEARAYEEHLDFDATMERLRVWIDSPGSLDRPHPVGGDTVRVMTVHQAKGLEFPAVMLWDSRASWTERTAYDAWTVEREGRGWALRLDTLKWEEPATLDIAARERAMREAERKRLVYVAATRARDLLIIPKVGESAERWILGRLLGGRPLSTVLEQPLHTQEAHAEWFDAVSAIGIPVRHVTTRDVELNATWEARAHVVAADYRRPLAFTDVSSPRVIWGKKGRLGTVFGETVHLAIGLAVKGSLAIDDAVDGAAQRTGLTTNLDTAKEDVARALATLADLGVGADTPYELEYPISGLLPGGQLVSGYIDLVVNLPAGLVLLDFKTDTPPGEGQPVPQRYVDQVQGYASVLEDALELRVRAGLLFTADGEIRWLSAGNNGRA